jgi:hypothetical protein
MLVDFRVVIGPIVILLLWNSKRNGRRNVLLKIPVSAKLHFYIKAMLPDMIIQASDVTFGLLRTFYSNTGHVLRTYTTSSPCCCSRRGLAQSITPVTAGVKNKSSASSSLYLWLRYSGMFGMTVLNPACGVMAMRYISPSICAPFSGLTMVWILLFSGRTIGEYPTATQSKSPRHVLSCSVKY